MRHSEELDQESALELAGSFGTEVPEPLMAAAEEVRGWFVLARGGAPFLSSADGRTLVQWLENGISVTSILRAVEVVSERRIARRSRGPFHLEDCEATLKKILKGKLGSSASVESPRSEETHPLAEQALQRLRAIPPGAPEARLETACQIAREFHEALWDSLSPEHPELIASAEEELQDLRELLGDSGLRRAAEERARALARSRFPQLSITRICEEFQIGVE